MRFFFSCAKLSLFDTFEKQFMVCFLLLLFVFFSKKSILHFKHEAKGKKNPLGEREGKKQCPKE